MEAIVNLCDVRVAADGSVTIDAETVGSLGLKPGDALAAYMTRGGIWLRPDGFDPDQWWFWTPEWQEGEAEVEADIAAGRTGRRFMSDEEFVRELAAMPFD